MKKNNIPENPLHQMKGRLPRVGRLEWIGLRPEKNAQLMEVDLSKVNTDFGLEGDHYRGRSGNRMVTLIQAEHIDGVGRMLGIEKVDPGLLRRNLVISGINLQAFKDQHLRIGEEVILEMTGQCHPCSKMEINLGPGGYNAMRGHGGITCRVLKAGSIRKGDTVQGVGNIIDHKNA